MPPLLLASASPRRAQLLEQFGIAFEVRVLPTPELGGGMPAAELAVENARRKALAVARLEPQRWVLGADTVVALGDRLLGKPRSLAEARDFLRALSGQTHEVVTGCCLCKPGPFQDSFYEITRVTFRRLDEEMIDAYLGAVDVLDKAGAYAIQEEGGRIIAGIEGSRANVIGLPMERLLPVLRGHGLR